jgi:hypothetical protein
MVSLVVTSIAYDVVDSKEGGGMKRIIGTAIGALVYSIVLPLAALAQDGSGLGPPGGAVSGGGGSNGGGVSGGVSGGGGVAFTGAEITGLVAVAIALVLIGITLVRATRRRALVAREQA